MNILFLTPSDLSSKINNGGVFISKQNLTLLRSLENTNVTAISLTRNRNAISTNNLIFIPASRNKLFTFLNTFAGYSSYLTHRSEAFIMKNIIENTYDVIFIDSSNFGRIVKKIKKVKPNLKTISYFHNVESIYGLSKVKIEGIQYFPLFFSNRLNEKMCIKYSDKLISISSRDKYVLEEKYKCKIDSVISVWFPFPNKEIDTKLRLSEPLNVLFLGSYFHANVDGISWFIDNVLLKANIHLTVAGRDMEKLSNKYLDNDKLSIIGTVESLEDMYESADCVVAPIFDGSGMKVKTGEAFRFGRTVIGSNEAIEGYNVVDKNEVYICSSADDYLSAFSSIQKQEYKFNLSAFKYFKENLSENLVIKEIKRIILDE